MNSDFTDFESLLPSMSQEEVLEWFHKRLNKIPEAVDIYKVSQAQRGLPIQ